jgi:hypothetical protein
MANLFSRITVILFLVVAQFSLAVENFSHSEWGSVLADYVDEAGLVDYKGLSKNRHTFDRYLIRIENMGPVSNPELFPTRDDELAFYINAYNALVFKGVLGRGPEEVTVWNGLISGFLFFEWMDIQIDGQMTSLKLLEDDIIRARYKDPRIHAAINCASISCPRLPGVAYVGDDLDAQLEMSMVEFANAKSNVRIDGGKLYLSSIFDWFADDFVFFEQQAAARSNDKDGMDRNVSYRQDLVVNYINRFRAPADQLDRNLSIEFIEYNRNINKQ